MLFILQASMISSRSLPELFKRFCTPTSFISTSPRFVIRYFANPLFLIVFLDIFKRILTIPIFCFYCTLFFLLHFHTFFPGYSGQVQNSCVGWNNFLGRFFFSLIYCSLLHFFTWNHR